MDDAHPNHIPAKKTIKEEDLNIDWTVVVEESV